MIVPERFCGPPETGNGGYCAGLFAELAFGCGRRSAVEVTLRRPVPLRRELVLTLGETAELRDGEELIAEARARVTLAGPAPAAVPYGRAEELSHSYVGHKRHHFPGCFVCGPGRSEGDGLRIFPGSGAEHEGAPVAAPWVPGATLPNDAGALRPELLWAALDCTGYFGAAAPSYPVALLGRMSAELYGAAHVGERCVVVGELERREGRKLLAKTALYGEAGALLGQARQTWIVVADAPVSTPR